jgi:hypothetical protein
VIAPSFARIGFPRRDQAADAAAPCADHQKNPITDGAHHLDPPLAVVAALILRNQASRIEKDVQGLVESTSCLAKLLAALASSHSNCTPPAYGFPVLPVNHLSERPA